MIERVLSIETSCDDTSVALVSGRGFVDAVTSVNQDLAHEPFGGIVPEIACRNHTLNLLPLVEKTLLKANLTWQDVHAIAVTNRPGLIGSLMVGVITAKTLALAKHLPFIGINHLEGHLLAPFLSDSTHQPPKEFTFPYVGLAVSGGHTSLYDVRSLGEYFLLGQTRDDAAGEAFDKFAKTLGLGFPGGVKVDKHGAIGDKTAFQFPKALLSPTSLDFSFSGIKSAALRLTQSMDNVQEHLNDLCASYQETIVSTLVEKLDRAIEQTRRSTAVITGGVSANSRLRKVAEEWAQKKGVLLVVPPLRYCTDNAAMIGVAGLWRLQRGERSEQSIGASPKSFTNDFYLVQN